MKKTTYEKLINAIEQKTRSDGTEFYCIKDKEAIGEDIHNLLVHQCLDRIDDISYSILNDALYIFQDLELPEARRFDINEYDNEIASVYTSDLLSYINIWNDGEVSDIMKDYECETVSQACAVWYEQEVKRVFQIIQDYIINN